MRTKNILLAIIAISCLIVPFSLICFSNANLHSSDPDIEWGIKEGSKYTWVVKVTSIGFLPVNSKYELTIISIETEGEQSELFVNLTAYNSVSEITTTILNNQSFIYFDAGTNTTSFYNPITDFGFFMPTNYRDHFWEGLRDYFFDIYDFNQVGTGTNYGILDVHGVYYSEEIIYIWFFNSKLIVTDIVVANIYADLNDPDDFDYWAKLQVSKKESIPYGNFFLIFMGLAIFSIIYLYKKKEK